jgi:uncharacterized protein YuzB (UPF0349 family)
MMLGKDRNIRVFDYHSSTKAGACGAPYVALSDGAIVGFHGIGAASVKVVPQFYACNAGWAQELKDWSHSVNVNFGDDDTYSAEHNREINVINGKPVPGHEAEKSPALLTVNQKGDSSSSSASAVAALKADFQ